MDPEVNQPRIFNKRAMQRPCECQWSMNYGKQPGSCKDGHFSVSVIMSILSISPWLFQVRFRRFQPHLWRSYTLQCWLCHTPSKWRLHTVRTAHHNHLCSLPSSKGCVGGNICNHLQVWYSSFMATKHVWETRIYNTIHITDDQHNFVACRVQSNCIIQEFWWQ